MKMNSFKILTLILFVAFGLGACENFLTPTPDNQYTKERFTKDPAWARGLLINAYASSAYPNAYPFDEVATDDAVSNDQANNYMRMATGEWSSLFWPDNVWTGNSRNTTSAYGAIINMNYFLSIVNDVTWAWQDTIRNRLTRQRYTGEALGFRGFFTLRLLQQFGGITTSGDLMGVPLITNVVTSADDWKVQRATFQETVDQINSDFTEALKLIPYTYTDIPSASTAYALAWNRVNGKDGNLNLLDGKRITALKARLALLAASPAFNDGTNYNLVQADSAVQIAGRLITNNGGLNTSVAADAIWWNENADINNPDILWRNDYANSSTLELDNYPPSLSGRGRINPTQNFVDAFPMKNGYPITDPLSLYDFANPYANRDPRLNVQVLFNGGKERVVGTIGSNNVINTQFDNTTATANDGLNVLATFSTRTGYYLKKLLRTDVSVVSGSATQQRHFYPLIRWTEMLLLYAEAANEKYGPDGATGFAFTARDVITALRARGAGNAITAGGIPQPDLYLASVTSPAGMRTLIRNERRIELSFEGFRFWDVRRWKVPFNELAATPKGVMITGAVAPLTYNYTDVSINPVEKRSYLSYMYYGPIPYLETKKYPGFNQNAGW